MLFIYGKPNCEYCSLSTLFLNSRNIGYEYIDITKDEKALHFVKHEMQRRTVPFIMDTSLEGSSSIIGGYEELLKRYQYNDPDELFD